MRDTRSVPDAARHGDLRSHERAVKTLAVTDHSSPRRWVSGQNARVLLCASGASFMIMLDSNIVAVSLPTIAGNLNAVFSDIEWIVSAYILTFAAFLMPAGALADRFGRRRLLMAGLVIFTLASLMCGLAPSVLILNTARAAQGIGAAIQLSAALAILGHTFRGTDRSKAFAFWGTVIGVAVAVGPLVGCIITSTLGWRWVFFINIPVGCLLIWLTLSSVEESNDPGAQRLDVAGMALFGAGLFSLVWALIDANGDGWSGRSTIIKFIVAATLLVLFVAVELIQKRPMVDFGLFRKRTFLGSSFAMLGFASSAQVMMTYLPLYLQNGFGFSPIGAGVRMLPFALPLFILPRIAAKLATRVSGQALLTAGLAIVVLGNVITAATVATQSPYVLIAIGMAVTGIGAGLLNGETAKVSMSTIPPERAGMASGIGGTLRFVGLVTGITGLGAILTRETGRYFAQDTATGSISHFGISGSDSIVTRIVAGDLAGAVSDFPVSTQALMIETARHSFAAGFAITLFVAAVIAALAAVLTYIFVSAKETAPHEAQPTGQIPPAVD